MHPGDPALLFRPLHLEAVQHGAGLDPLGAAVVDTTAAAEMVGDRLADAIDLDASDDGIDAGRGFAVVPGGQAVDVEQLQGEAPCVAGWLAAMNDDQAFAVAGTAAGERLAKFGEGILASDLAVAALPPLSPGIADGAPGAVVRASRGIIDQRNQARGRIADDVGFDDVEVVAGVVVIVFQRA